MATKQLGSGVRVQIACTCKRTRNTTTLFFFQPHSFFFQPHSFFFSTTLFFFQPHSFFFNHTLFFFNLTLFFFQPHLFFFFNHTFFFFQPHFSFSTTLFFFNHTFLFQPHFSFNHTFLSTTLFFQPHFFFFQPHFFFQPVGAQLYIPHLFEIVARRPVYVRLALRFLHHPAWVKGHTGGSRLTPTVHPCPVQLGRLWVAYVVHEPNEPQEDAQPVHGSGARVQDHDPGASQPVQLSGTIGTGHGCCRTDTETLSRTAPPERETRAARPRWNSLKKQLPRHQSTLLLHSRDAGECHVGHTLR